MTHEGLLRDKVELLAFDVYDTLLPFRPKLLPAFRAYLDERGYDADPEPLFENWQTTLLHYMSVNNAVDEPRRPILEVGHRALEAVLSEAGLEYTDEEVRSVLEPWTALEPHDDVVENFRRLGEEYTLVCLSNGDPDMLEAVRPSLGGAVDAMLSTARAGAFKPSPEPYELLLDRFDLAAHEVLFVAAHDFDIVGPQRVGMYACYVERVGPYGEWPNDPDLRVEGMDELANALLN